MQATTTQLLMTAKKLQQENKLEAAKQIYQQLLKQEPNNIDVLHLLGILHHQLKNYDTAINYFKKVIKLNDRIPQLYHNLGLAYKGKNQLEEAIACYQTAIALDKNYAAVYEKLANVYITLDEPLLALNNYQASLKLQPNNPNAWLHMAQILHKFNMQNEAIASYQNVLKLQPNSATALAHLANIYYSEQQYETSFQLLKNATKLAAYNYEITAELLPIFDNFCYWQDYEERQQQFYHATKEALMTNKATHVKPFTLLYQDWPITMLLSIAKQYARAIEAKSNSNVNQLNFIHKKNKKERLRIGYISSDFRSHPVAYLTNNLFAKHDRNFFTVVGFSIGPSQSNPYRDHIAASCDEFYDLFLMNDFEAAQKIYECNIDILIDLNGYTQGARSTILALRPAAIQAHYLGYLGTTGANFYDYILADKIVVPPEIANIVYSEKPVYLPHYQIFDDQTVIANGTLTRKDYGLPENSFVFCCFNNTYKIKPHIFSIWMEILKATPNSILWLLQASNIATENLKQTAANQGVDPARLIFANYEERANYLARYRLADLFLDTPFYNANTTGSDALWAGLPLLTSPTTNFAGRGATSALTALNLPELIAADLPSYRDIAIDLYSNPEKLQALRARLKHTRLNSAWFNTSATVSYLEKAYQAMWQLYLEGKSPEIISIN